MNPGPGSDGSYAIDVLATLASGLGVDSRESGRKALAVMRARAPELIARGYLEHVGEEHRARESEMYGLAAIVTAMGRSLDLHETAEVALVESLAVLRLSTGGLWLRERSSYKLVHTVGLDQDQIDGFARQVGPHVKAAA